jgi:hypothetical protein
MQVDEHAPVVPDDHGVSRHAEVRLDAHRVPRHAAQREAKRSRLAHDRPRGPRPRDGDVAELHIAHGRECGRRAFEPRVVGVER